MFQHSVIFAFYFLLMISFFTVLDKRQDSHITVIHQQEPALSRCCIKKKPFVMLYTLVVLRDQHSSFSILLGNTSRRKARNRIDFPNFIKELVKQRSVIGHACLAACFQLQPLLSCAQKAAVGANKIARKMALAGEHRMLYSGPLSGFVLEIMTLLRLLYKLIFCLLLKHIKCFSTGRVVHKSAQVLDYQDFLHYATNRANIVHNPCSPCFLEKAVYALCVQEKVTSGTFFADSLNCKLIGYNKKLCKWENSELLDKKIGNLKAIPADSFLLIVLPEATFLTVSTLTLQIATICTHQPLDAQGKCSCTTSEDNRAVLAPSQLLLILLQPPSSLPTQPLKRHGKKTIKSCIPCTFVNQNETHTGC